MNRRDFDRMDPWTLGAMMDEENEEIGALIETPSAILAKMKQTDSLVQTLETDIRSHTDKLRPVFTNAWDLFLKEWQSFYKENSEGFAGWTSRLWGATSEQTDSYLDRAKKWREGYEKESGIKATGPSTSDKGLPWKWILGGVLVVSGIVAVGYAARGIRGVAEAF